MLCAIARDPESTVRDLAAAVGITERAATTIVGDLVRDGYLVRKRVGRRNEYRIVRRKHFRHALNREIVVGDLLELLGVRPPGRSS